MPEEIWRLRRVLSVIGMGRSWLYDEIGKGRFPAPMKLGVRAVGWRRSDVEAWLHSRKTCIPRGVA